MNPSVLAATQSAPSSEPSAGARLRAGVGYYVPSLLVMLALLVIWQVGVERFLRATHKGWRDAKADPAGSIVALGVKEYILPTPLQAVRTLADPNYQWTATRCWRRCRRSWTCASPSARPSTDWAGSSRS